MKTLLNVLLLVLYCQGSLTNLALNYIHEECPWESLRPSFLQNDELHILGSIGWIIAYSARATNSPPYEWIKYQNEDIEKVMKYPAFVSPSRRNTKIEDLMIECSPGELIGMLVRSITTTTSVEYILSPPLQIILQVTFVNLAGSKFQNYLLFPILWNDFMTSFPELAENERSQLGQRLIAIIWNKLIDKRAASEEVLDFLKSTNQISIRGFIDRWFHVVSYMKMKQYFDMNSFAEATLTLHNVSNYYKVITGEVLANTNIFLIPELKNYLKVSIPTDIWSTYSILLIGSFPSSPFTFGEIVISSRHIPLSKTITMNLVKIGRIHNIPDAYLRNHLKPQKNAYIGDGLEDFTNDSILYSEYMDSALVNVIKRTEEDQSTNASRIHCYSCGLQVIIYKCIAEIEQITILVGHKQVIIKSPVDEIVVVVMDGDKVLLWKGYNMEIPIQSNAYIAIKPQVTIPNPVDEIWNDWRHKPEYLISLLASLDFNIFKVFDP